MVIRRKGNGQAFHNERLSQRLFLDMVQVRLSDMHCYHWVTGAARVQVALKWIRKS